MFTYIEELIIQLTMNNIDYSNMHQRDKTVIFSLSTQLKNSIALTQKQADLIIKILDNNIDMFPPHLCVKDMINQPKFRFSFRVVDQSKSIKMVEGTSKKIISIKFPYDRKKSVELYSIEGVKFEYDKESKSYKTPYKHSSLYNLMSSDLVNRENFVIDDELKSTYESIKNIKDNDENFLPLIDFDNGIVLRNCHRKIEEYFNENKKDSLISNVFLANSLGLTKSKKVIENIKSMNLEKRLQKILLQYSKKVQISSKVFDFSNMADLICKIDHWPIMIILIDDEHSNTNLENWHTCLENVGIHNEQISVLFRSSHNPSFNQYISSMKLNNIVSDSTKVVFIKNKIPKILYKIGFYPKIIISTSSFYAHFSAQKTIESHPCVLYYTNQTAEIGINFE